MKGREHEVTGEARLHRYLGCLGIADLADHDDVGVLPENRAKTVRKRKIYLRVHLDLHDTRQLVLDRVFDGYDVLVGRVDSGKGAVESRRLPAAGRTGDQDDPAGAGQESLDHDILVRRQTDVG